MIVFSFGISLYLMNSIPIRLGLVTMGAIFTFVIWKLPEGRPDGN